MSKKVREVTNNVIDAVENGLLSWEAVAMASLNYLSEDQVKEMARDNDWFPDEDDEDDD